MGNAASEYHLLQAWHYPDCVYIRCLLGDQFIQYFHNLQRGACRVVPDSDTILREDIRIIPEGMLCTSCHRQRSAVLFLPCRHLFLCPDCGISAVVCSRCGKHICRFQYVQSAG